MIPRKLQKHLESAFKSVLLLGPRQTGKSTLCKVLKPTLTINLMREQTYLEFVSNPRRLEEILAASQPGTILIDEIQRLPSLLNTIQVVLDEKNYDTRFILTGSSARKLRRGAANLLPGRLLTYKLGPVCASEFNYELSNSIIQYGSLPEVYLLERYSQKEKLLSSYVGTYLKEEIQADALAKNIEGFARFLTVAAAESSHFLDLAKLAQQAQVDRSSAVRWFEILEDTLLVHRTDSFSKSTRKRLIQHPRFFFFDNGILNALLRNFVCSPDRQGALFENLFCSQLFSSAAASDLEISVTNFRTSHGAEVDFIVSIGTETFAVECKAVVNVPNFSRTGFESFEKYLGKPVRKIVAYQGTDSLQRDDVSILPWQIALRDMGL